MTHWPLALRYLNKRLVQVQERFIRNERVVGLPFYLTLESGKRKRACVNATDALPGKTFCHCQ